MKVKKGLLFFMLATSLVSCAQQQEKKANYLEHVGDIKFDSELDDPNFNVCDSLSIPQYYEFGKSLQYKGEKPAINNHFNTLFQRRVGSESGYITIRFIVNCEGKTGWFRVQEMGIDYTPKKFNKALREQLLLLTKQLNGWASGEYNERKFDYYQYLTFKLQDGKLIEIMP